MKFTITHLSNADNCYINLKLQLILIRVLSLVFRLPNDVP